MANIVASGQITLVDLNDAKSLSSYINSNQPRIQINNPDTGVLNPNWTSTAVVLTPELYVTGSVANIIAEAKSVTWYENDVVITTGVGGYTIPASGVKTLTINQNKLSVGTPSIVYSCEIVWTDVTFGADIVVKTQIDFSRVSSGSASITGLLSNETHGIPTDAAGGNANYGGAATTMSVFLGSTDDSAAWTVTAGTPVGLTGSLSGKTYTVATITADTGYVDLTATKGGSSIVKRFTVHKNRQGITGLNSINYKLNVDTKIVQRSVTGAITPGSISVSMTSQTGVAAPVFYQGRISIEESTNGSTWTTTPGYVSAANETAAKVYTPSATAKHVRFRLYMGGAAVVVGTGHIDEETTNIVSDGAAVTGFLTNDTQAVATLADGTGGVFTGSTVSTVMSVYVGNVDDSANWIYTLAPAPVGATAVFQGATVGTLAARSINVTGMSADNATVSVTATRAGYPTQTKVFNVNKNKQGIQGIQGLAATQYWITSDVETMVRSSTTASLLTPANLNINLKSQVGTGTPGVYAGRITVEEYNGSVWAEITQTPTNYKTTNLPGQYTYVPSLTAKQVRVRMYGTSTTVVTGTAVLDEQSIAILSDNATATGTLNNDTQVIPTLQDGTGGDFATGKAQSIMTVYVGTVDDSANWTYTLGATAGVTASFASVTAGSIGARTVNVTAMTVDSGTVTITAAKAGYPNVVKAFTISKNKQGIASTSYWLVTGAPAIGKSITGVFSPLSVPINPRSQTGTATVAAYTGRIFVEESINNGTSWTTKYDADANTYTYTPSGSVNLVRVSLYVAGAKTTLLDQELIPVVSDGATGQNAVIAYVWAPDGNVVKNGSGSVAVDCDIYNGTTAVTGTSYQWYKWDTSVLADQGGGINWLKLALASDGGGTTGYTTSVLTVPATAVMSMTSFKCIAVYGGKSYADVVTIIDQSDPVQVVLFSAEGTVYRNGEGEKNITAKVYRAGLELDSSLVPAEQIYEYRWTLRNEAGVVDTVFVDSGKSYKTGKVLTVPASVVTNIGNLVLELWTK